MPADGRTAPAFRPPRFSRRSVGRPLERDGRWPHVFRLEDQIREEIENAVIALQTAQSAYNAAVASRGYQEQLLDAERDKLAMGQSTNLLVVQNEAYLAQARSTEIVARSNWMKARIALDRALGNILEKNNIALDDAINGRGN